MTLEINSSSQKWIIEQMEELTKKVMYDIFIGDKEVILEKIGEFRGLLNLLTNSGYESYGLKFKVILPTEKEYSKCVDNSDE